MSKEPRFLFEIERSSRQRVVEIDRVHCIILEAYLGPCQISMVESFGRISVSLLTLIFLQNVFMTDI